MMKRILTLAIAAILVVAFAIPALAAPKVEIVGGMVEFEAEWIKTTGFVPDVAWSDLGLWFEFTADNFAFYVETYFNGGTDYYNFSLALPYMELTGDNTYNPSMTAVNPFIQLASDAKFEELAGFNWYAIEYYLSEEFWAGVGTTIGPVGLNLDYANDNVVTDDAATPPTKMEHYLGLGAAYDGPVSVAVNVGKKVTSAFDDFGADLTVGFPIVDGFTGELYASYAQENAYSSKLTLTPNTFSTSVDFRYNNEAANGQFYLGYDNTSKFDADHALSTAVEYVSNGPVSSSGNKRRDNYADDKWDSRFNWVRKNSGNEFAARVAFDYTLSDPAVYGVTGYAMFAPDFAPVVVSLKGTYDGTDFGICNWLGVRLNEDIHLALYDRYNKEKLDGVNLEAKNSFKIDASIVYNRDAVTFKLTGARLTHWKDYGSVTAFVGISF